LDLLIHDVRTPLGVVLGYLRLIKEERLPSREERDHALAQSLEALGRVARLCSDGSEYLAAHAAAAAEPTVSFEAAQLVALVKARMEAVAVTLTEPLTRPARLGVASAERLAGALATIMGSADRSSMGHGPFGVAVRIVDRRLCFLAGTEAEQAALAAGPHEAVDAWVGGRGLALLVAFTRVTDVGGEIWTTTQARPGIALALPLKDAPR
jgi:hypothetical protein